MNPSLFEDVPDICHILPSTCDLAGANIFLQMTCGVPNLLCGLLLEAWRLKAIHPKASRSRGGILPADVDPIFLGRCRYARIHASSFSPGSNDSTCFALCTGYGGLVLLIWDPINFRGEISEFTAAQFSGKAGSRKATTSGHLTNRK